MITARWSTILVVAFCLSGIAASRQASGQGRGRGAALTLPDGPGKDAVQTQCTKCHALGLIANSGGSPKQDWDQLIGTMVSLPPVQKSEIADYLATNFPEQPRPKPVVVPGGVNVNIREWNAASLGSRPHDPEPA